MWPPTLLPSGGRLKLKQYLSYSFIVEAAFMGINTRELTGEVTETLTSKPIAVGMGTVETIRVNALDFLNEMARPVRGPHESSLRFQPVPLEPSLRDRLQWQDIQPWHIVVMPTERPYDFLALELLGDVVMGSNDVIQA